MIVKTDRLPTGSPDQLTDLRAALERNNGRCGLHFRSSISSLNDEAAKATKKLSEASKLLRKVRVDLSSQIDHFINLTNLLQRGDEELKNDLNRMRRHEMNSPLVREAIIAGRLPQRLLLLALVTFHICYRHT